MNRVSEFEALLKKLQEIDAKERFTALFSQGCDLLELDDEDAARAFDTSRPNASRWRRGKVVPPAAALVLKFLREQVEQKIKKLKRIEANKREALSPVAPAPLAANGR
jgi:hypothetical protein